MRIKKLVNVATAAVITTFAGMAIQTSFAGPAQAPAHAWSSPCDWGGCYGSGPFYVPGYYGPFYGPGCYWDGTHIACGTPFNDCASPAGRPADPAAGER